MAGNLPPLLGLPAHLLPLLWAPGVRHRPRHHAHRCPSLFPGSILGQQATVLWRFCWYVPINQRNIFPLINLMIQCSGNANSLLFRNYSEVFFDTVLNLDTTCFKIIIYLQKQSWPVELRVMRCSSWVVCSWLWCEFVRMSTPRPQCYKML